jgi:hypothetical protein
MIERMGGSLSRAFSRRSARVHVRSRGTSRRLHLRAVIGNIIASMRALAVPRCWSLKTRSRNHTRVRPPAPAGGAFDLQEGLLNELGKKSGYNPTEGRALFCV